MGRGGGRAFKNGKLAVFYGTEDASGRGRGSMAKDGRSSAIEGMKEVLGESAG